MTQIFIEARYEKTSEYVFLNTIIKELGFSATLQRINQELQSNGMQADGIFLFPNNTDDGIFENLLEKLMQKETHEQWLHCYSDYETCLGNHYLTPNLKGKLFTYISAQKTLSNTQRNKLGSGQ